MADLGLGMYETGSWIALPDPWTAVFGLRGLGNLADKAGDLRVGAPVPGLPSLTRGMVSRGTFQSARREGTAPATSRHSYAVAGSVAEAQVTAGAIAFAPLAVRLDEQKRPIFAGLFANHFGAGLGVFATHSLWQYWPLDDDLSQALHGDLFARRARFALAQPGLLQRQLHFSGGPAREASPSSRRHPPNWACPAAQLASWSSCQAAAWLVSSSGPWSCSR
jgi:hypothetical protein